jgi:carboxylesterase
MFPPQVFQAAEHQPFTLEGGRPAALLVHGFPGTPAEMRPLGAALHRQGWTVHGLLLPGFGPQIETLFERRHTDWIAAVRQALELLHRRHAPLLVGGFSMGAALSLLAAASAPVDGLLLLAPYWKLDGPLWPLLPVLRRLFPRVRPFRWIKLDFNNAEMRKGFGEFMPGVDLDDPAVRQGIREFSLPIGIFDEIRLVGKAAQRASRQVTAPSLVIQGDRDRLVTPLQTRRLLQRLPRPLRYHEVPADHDLPDASRPAWPLVEAAVLDFAASLAGRADDHG